jgi:hypothetical protein
MVRHKPPNARAKLSPGPYVMLVGVLCLLDSVEPGDLSEDIGMCLLATGMHLHQIRLSSPELQEGRGRYGPRGPYEKGRTRQFIDSLLDTKSHRMFKRWFRCV